MYKVECVLCSNAVGETGGEKSKSSYYGTTGHKTCKRCMEHKTAVDGGKNEEIALAKHIEMGHPNEEPRYVISIVWGSRKHLEWYVPEALIIEKNFIRGEKIINGKGEWGIIKLPRLTIDEN